MAWKLPVADPETELARLTVILLNQVVAALGIRFA